MGLFSKILATVGLGRKKSEPAPPAPPPPVTPSASASVPEPPPPEMEAPAPPPSPEPPPPLELVDVLAIVAEKAKQSGEKDLDWKRSIVDLLKALGLDSSLSARRELADELGYTGDKQDTSTMNQWLIKEVMNQLAENGGNIPDELR